MTTPWFYPCAVTQYAEVPQHVSWAGLDNNYVDLRHEDGAYLSTTKELLHIANPTVNNIKMKTWYLYLTDFRLANIPEVISGVQVEIEIKRGGRITDDTVQLRYQDQFIGDNRADYLLDIRKTYGGDQDLWSAALTPAMLAEASFGLGVRFQSHPAWPHREHPMLNYIKLRVY